MSDKKIVKIKQAHLYIGLTDSAHDCQLAVELLKAANVNYTLLNYNNSEEQHKVNFDSLSTWTFGVDNHKKIFTDYPILTWVECFDDWSSNVRAAHGLTEIKESDLINNKHLVE